MGEIYMHAHVHIHDMYMYMLMHVALHPVDRGYSYRRVCLWFALLTLSALTVHTMLVYALSLFHSLCRTAHVREVQRNEKIFLTNFLTRINKHGKGSLSQSSLHQCDASCYCRWYIHNYIARIELLSVCRSNIYPILCFSSLNLCW